MKWISLLRLLFSIYWEARKLQSVRRLFDSITSKSLSSSADDVVSIISFKLIGGKFEETVGGGRLLEPTCKLPRVERLSHWRIYEKAPFEETEGLGIGSFIA